MDDREDRLVEKTWFEILCGRLWGNSFQDFFERLMKKVDASFIPIRAHGKEGDWKCDGFSESSGRYFQVYAPRRHNEKEAIRKARRDFEGTAQKWGTKLREWVFVYGQFELSAPLTDALTTLAKEHNITILSWNNEDLWKLIETLSHDDRIEVLQIPSMLYSADRKALLDVRRLVEETQEILSTKMPKIATDSIGVESKDGSSFDDLRSLPQWSVTEIEKTFETLIERLEPESLLSKISKKWRKDVFLRRVWLQRFYKAFLKSCHLEISELVSEIDPLALKLVSMRMYGILATAMVGYFKSNPKQNREECKPLSFTLTVDLNAINAETEAWERVQDDAFFEWARKYRGYTEKPFDREILEMVMNNNWEGLIKNSLERHGYMTTDMMRANYLLRLNIAFAKEWIQFKYDKSTNPWILPLSLAIRSSGDLLKKQK
jgi:hypothetical protein